jgi:hypothetical protein
MSDNNNSLPGVEAFTFDCIGTVFDWLGSGSREVEVLAKSKGYAQSEDWGDFTLDWRKGFMYAVDLLCTIHYWQLCSNIDLEQK